VARLRDSFEVVTWDRRGHSRSQVDPGSGDYSEDVADLIALIEHLGGGAVHLVGNSSGAEIALRAVAARPDLVSSVAAHEPGLFGWLPQSDSHVASLLQREKRLCDEVVEIIEAGDNARAAERFIEQVLGEGAWEMTPPDLRSRMIENAPTFVAEGHQTFSQSEFDPTAIRADEVPILMTVGTASNEVNRIAARFVAERLPGSRLEELEGAGHIPHRSHPDLYAAQLLAFLGAVEAREVPA
jgi:pimeloyl-ACP methyl ester carboxylesterase